jgi:hypothetical protein
MTALQWYEALITQRVRRAQHKEEVNIMTLTPKHKYLWAAMNQAPDFNQCVLDVLDGIPLRYPHGCTFPWRHKDQLSWQDMLDAAQLIRDADAAGIKLREEFADVPR